MGWRSTIARLKEGVSTKIRDWSFFPSLLWLFFQCNQRGEMAAAPVEREREEREEDGTTARHIRTHASRERVRQRRRVELRG